MSAEKPNTWVQESHEGQLESTNQAVEVARKAKQDLDRLHQDIESGFPKPETLNTPGIEIKKQTEITEKGLLAILKENSPELKRAFDRNPKLARLAYGHMFHEMEKFGLDANALPVNPKKPIEMVMVDGVVTINMPTIQKEDGTWLYEGARFDLLPWTRKEEGGKITAVEEPEADETEAVEPKAANEKTTLSPEENRERVPKFMSDLEGFETRMKQFGRETERFSRQLNNEKIDTEEAQAYLDERDSVLGEIVRLEMERDTLVKSRGLEYTSLEKVNQRLDAVRAQYDETKDTTRVVVEKMLLNELEEEEQDPNFREYLNGLKLKRDQALATLLTNITEATGLETNLMKDSAEMLHRKGKVTLLVSSRMSGDKVDVSSSPTLTMPGIGNSDKVFNMGTTITSYNLENIDLKYPDKKIQAAREAKVKAETMFIEDYDVAKLASRVDSQLEKN